MHLSAKHVPSSPHDAEEAESIGLFLGKRSRLAFEDNCYRLDLHGMVFVLQPSLMTTEPAASAWDSMSEREQTYWIAENIMGWRKDEGGSLWHQTEPYRADFELEATNYEGDYDAGWRPTEDWNQWRQVELKVMEDEVLAPLYFTELLDAANKPWINAAFMVVQRCIEAGLLTRAHALYLAYQSLRA